MGVNWAQAAKVAGTGFGTVFAMLIILAIIFWLLGLGFQARRKKGEQAKTKGSNLEVDQKDK